MIKINLGCGPNLLPGWDNRDVDCDITKPLPFPDNYADFIFNEHVIEHIGQYDGYRFLEECKRVLKVGGILRTATPDLIKICSAKNENYEEVIRNNGWGKNSVEAILS